MLLEIQLSSSTALVAVAAIRFHLMALTFASRDFSQGQSRLFLHVLAMSSPLLGLLANVWVLQPNFWCCSILNEELISSPLAFRLELDTSPTILAEFVAFL